MFSGLYSWRDHLTTDGAVRLLIASYFIAVAIGVIPGTELSVLLQLVLPDAQAEFATSLMVFTLAVMIITGVQRRAAALLLGITVFWGSYMNLMADHSTDVLGGFWRDLALIGALTLTYTQSTRAPKPTEGRVGIIGRVISRPRSERAKVDSYREDLSDARSS